MSNQTVAGFRLSNQQDRIWSQQVSENAPLWAECELVVDGPLDTAKLQDAIRAVVGRHEIIRTAFHRQTGVKVPFQVIQDAIDFTWTSADLSGFDPKSQRDRLREVVNQQRLAFTFEKGPTLQVMVGQVGADKHILNLSLPAMCADLRSLQNVTGEVIRAYTGELDPSEEAMQYADFAEWQQELLASEESKPARDYWRDYCREIDFSSLPSLFAGFEKKTKGEFAPATVLREIDVKSVSNADHEALSDLLLASWVALLSRMAGRPAITVGCEFDGRTYSELENAVGSFAKSLPLTADCSEAVTFAGLRAQFSRDVQDFRKWQDSFAWKDAGLSQEQAPILPFAFEYHEQPESIASGGVVFTTVEQKVFAEQFRLRLAVRRSTNSLELAFEYDAGSVEREAVERLSLSYLTLLRGASEQPETLISRLPILDNAERQRW